MRECVCECEWETSLSDEPKHDNTQHTTHNTKHNARCEVVECGRSDCVFDEQQRASPVVPLLMWAHALEGR